MRFTEKTAVVTGADSGIGRTTIVNALTDRIPLRKIASPEWVASAICYLASEEACYTTGACLDVDRAAAAGAGRPAPAARAPGSTHER